MCCGMATVGRRAEGIRTFFVDWRNFMSKRGSSVVRAIGILRLIAVFVGISSLKRHIRSGCDVAGCLYRKPFFFLPSASKFAVPVVLCLLSQSHPGQFSDRCVVWDGEKLEANLRHRRRSRHELLLKLHASVPVIRRRY